MMSKINAPIHSYKNPQKYYQCPKIWQKKFGNFFGNFFLKNGARYVDLDLISVPCFLIFFINPFANKNSIHLFNIYANNCFNGELCICLDKLEFSFFFFPFIDKLYRPVCSTVPASLQARGRRPRDCNKG